MSQYAKGDGGARTSYASGGPSLSRREDYTKPNDTKFKRGDFKSAKDIDLPSVPNLRTEDHKGSDETYGAFLGGGDRFTSTNFAEQGEPANIQRIKPDEDWSKKAVPPNASQKGLRQGDGKSEKPIKPRK